MKVEKLDVPYAQVANELLYDKNLSLRAKGLYAYIQAKPNDYDFSTHRMPEEHKDGRESIRAAIAELMKYGYLIRTKYPDGRMEYKLHNPKSGNPTMGQSRETRPIIKKELYIKKKRFEKPTLDEVRAYCREQNSLVDPEEFWNSNEGKGWVVGTTKTPMVDWKAVIRTWNIKEKKKQEDIKAKEKPNRAVAPPPVMETYTPEELEANKKKLAEIRNKMFNK